MAEGININEVIDYIGDTELNANPVFRKYKEHCPIDPYGIIINRSYRAKLSDIVPDSEVFSLSSDNLFVLVDISLLKNAHEPVNICISAFPSVSFGDTDNSEKIKYCGSKEDPAMVMTKDVNKAEQYLKNMLTADNIVKAGRKVLV